MKKTFVFYIALLFIISLSNLAFAQATHTIDFENGGVGADWNWIVAENDDNPPLEFIANPVSGGINTSATVAKFTARLTGQPWALCHTSDDGVFTFDASNSTVTIMIHKPVISDVGLKFEGQSGNHQIVIPNTLTNQWEEMTFDFSSQIGNTYGTMVIIPDFDMAGRTQENIIYFDNIQAPDGEVTGPLPEPTVAAPTPIVPAADVISVFSDAYTNIAGTNFNPGWGQTTVVTTEEIGGNSMLKYANFNYQGTEFAGAQDLSSMNYMHIDMWTPNATVVKVTPISASTGEHLAYMAPITLETWNSYDIPVSDFTGVSMADIIQLKFDGQEGVTPSVIYLDNIYFYSSTTPSAPTVAAPIPTQNAADVISIFSDSYTDLAGTNFNPGWGQTTIVTFEDIGGNSMMKYDVFNYQGTELAAPQDLTAMDYMHIDMWTADATIVKATPISATTGEFLVSLTPITSGTWNSYDIPLGDFTGVSMADIFQLKFDGQEGVTPSTIYLDNIFFYSIEAPPAPTVAAPIPTVPANDVISIYSDSYTDIAGTNFNPGWGQTTIVTFEDIGGNEMMKYDVFNYQGTELAAPQDLTAMDYMHIDMWTADATVVKVSPISSTTGEFLVSLVPITPETWNSYDIPVSDFAGVSMADIFQLKFDGQEGVTPSTIYLDNIYFYNDGTAPTFDPPQNVMVDDETGLVTWTPPATTIDSDDFDSYTVGDYLAVVNPDLWTTWSNAPGGPEDVVVTDAQSNSPDNSILVELNNDNVMIMDDYTSGVYSMDIDMYIPTGFCGYYNMQKTSVPGTEWAFQIYFLTDGTTIIDAGAASAATFNYLHDEWMDLRIVIDLDSDWADFYYNGTHIIGYQWSLGTFGTPGLLQLGGMNIFGGANSGTTDVPMFYVDNMEFKDLTAVSDELTGYNVYLDGAFVAYTDDEFYQLTGLTPGQTYVAGVSAVYDDPGESEIITYEFTYNIPLVLPPTNLTVTVEDYNNVLVAWEAPNGSPVALWDQMGNPGADGGISAQDFEAANDIYDAEGADDFVVPAGETWTLTEVDVLGTYSVAGPCDLANVRIYADNAGMPGTLMYEYLNVPADPSPEGNLFCEIPDTQLTEGTYWMSVQGRMDYTPGGQWYWSRQGPPTIGYEFHWQNPGGGFGGLTTWGPGSVQWPGQTCYDLSFVIFGIATDGVVTTVYDAPEREAFNSFSRVESRVSRNVISRTPAMSTVEVGSLHGSQSYNSRSLSGYKVYRDGVEIAEIFDPLVMSYLDEGLDAGSYDYYATAIYTNPDDESGPSNTETAVITLPAPTGLNCVSNWPNILCTWTAMPGVLGFNLYQNDVFVTYSTSTFYLHANVPAGTYTYNLAAVFNGNWEGAWSTDIEVVHEDPNGVDPNLIPLVTSLDGNYPNPFNPTTTIKFGLHEDQKVAISVYNVKGEKVRTLVNGELEAGYHSILWNGKDDSGKTAASGVYFYKMKAGKYIKTQKMLMMK